MHEHNSTVRKKRLHHRLPQDFYYTYGAIFLVFAVRPLPFQLISRLSYS